MPTSDFIGRGHSIYVNIPNELNAIMDLSPYHPRVSRHYTVNTKYKNPKDPSVVILNANWGPTAMSITSKLRFTLKTDTNGVEYLIDNTINHQRVGINQWELLSWRLDKLKNKTIDGVTHPFVMEDTLTWKPTITKELIEFISLIESKEYESMTNDSQSLVIMDKINKLKESFKPVVTKWTWIFN